MKILNTSLLLAVVVLLFSSCKDDAKLLPYASLNAYFATQKAPVQTHTVDPTTTEIFILDNGTEFTFNPNSICHQNGDPVVGNVKVEFKEVFKKSEMLFDQKPTQSDGLLLESGGVLNVHITQNSEVLKICGNTSFRIPKSPATQNPSEMTLFIGEEVDGEFNWVADSIQAEFWVDSNYYNAFLFSDYDWINCDYFYSETGPKTTVRAVPTGNGGTSTNTRAFLVFSDINAIASMTFNASTNKFESYENSIPIGLTATVVIIGMSDTGFFLGTQAITVIPLLEVSVELTEVTEEELEAAIEALD